MTSLRWLAAGCMLLAGCGGKGGGDDDENGKHGRPASRQLVESDLHQIFLALEEYYANNGGFPPAQHADRIGNKAEGWRVALLPYLEQNPVYLKHFMGKNPKQSWNDPELLKLRIPTYSRILGGDTTETPYRVFVGPNCIFERNRTAKKESVLDGLAQTILVVEAAENVPWSSDKELEYDPVKPVPKLGGSSKEGFFALMANGQIRLIKHSVSEKVLRNLIQRDDGEFLGDDW